MNGKEVLKTKFEGWAFLNDFCCSCDCEFFKLKNSVDFKSVFLCIFEWFLWHVKMSVAMWIVNENVTIEFLKWCRQVKCLTNDLNELWGCICLTCGYGMEIQGFICVIALWVSCMLAWFPFG